MLSFACFQLARASLQRRIQRHQFIQVGQQQQHLPPTIRPFTSIDARIKGDGVASQLVGTHSSEGLQGPCPLGGTGQRPNHCVAALHVGCPRHRRKEPQGQGPQLAGADGGAVTHHVILSLGLQSLQQRQGFLGWTASQRKKLPVFGLNVGTC